MSVYKGKSSHANVFHGKIQGIDAPALFCCTPVVLAKAVAVIAILLSLSPTPLGELPASKRGRFEGTEVI